MKSFIRGAGAIFVMLLTTGLLGAQSGPRVDDGRDVVVRGSGGPHFGSSSGGATAVPVSPSSGAVAGAVSAPSSPSYTGQTGSPVPYPPSLQGTSFSSSTTFYDSYNYYSYLSMRYNVDPFYFNRFYRNSEPLLTPAMLKLTLSEPINLSSQMLVAISRLEALLKDEPSGNSVDKSALVDESKKIRKLARQIRQNRTISYVSSSESRKEEDVYREGDISEVLGPGGLNKLREMATDVNRQLRTMYSLSSTSTVSVDHFNEPSLDSLTKGIEKLSKAIENSSKRL
jgi:hypothetical protein